MDNEKKWHISLVFILTATFGLANSQPNFTQYFCSNGVGNYTQNSTYQSNLNALFSSLSSNISPYGFYNATIGEDPDQVYLIVLCRGDASIQDCQDCVRDSVIQITRFCPNQKEAIGWYTKCLLKYSNTNIFDNMTTHPNFNLRSSVVPSNLALFKQELSNLSSDLRNQTYTGSSLLKFAAGQSRNESGMKTIYAYMQCTPDLNAGDCNLCLGWAMMIMAQCCSGVDGARVVGPSCSYWYESFPFIDMNVILSRSALQPPVSTQPPSPLSKGKGGNKTIIIVICVIVGLVVAVASLCLFIFGRKWKRRGTNKLEDLDEIDGAEIVQYEFGVIRAATNNFSDANLLGKGGFGAVYKGVFSDAKVVAVKRLSKNSGQGEQEFRNEVLLVAKLQHKNLVRLLGFCLMKTEKLLVYEFMSNGSLDQVLFDPVNRSQLDWETRFKVIESIARGLVYLHEDSRLKIIHRDLKASNILLDDHMNAKISDFGLAKLFHSDESAANTIRVAGTYGYMAPEYALRGLVSNKSDVFSYGVLVLEIISGQKNRYVQDGQNVEDLLSQVWKNWIRGTVSNLIDATLINAGSGSGSGSSSGSLEVILRCIHIGLLCVQDNAANRPTMATVMLMLHSFSLTLPIPSEPAYFSESTINSSTKTTSSSSDRIQPAAVNRSLNEASISDLDPR